ncbi:MAG: hypothetical protein MJ189_02595 [Coriobacteriales bacterium]|nr:hypothetical protein [Coriobacteriales bacterium]
MTRFYTSDLHFGHANIIKLANRRFNDIDEMNACLINNINSRVSADDELYILGDFSYKISKEDVIAFRNQLNCKNIYLIYGNHDHNYDDSDVFTWCGDYKTLNTDQGKIIMFHYPILEWDQYFEHSLHLHGHQHNHGDYNLKMREEGLLRYDVGVDAHDYFPVSEEEIREFFA